MDYRFTVRGNPKNPKGNPQPYFRQTQGSKWNPKAKEYHNWCIHVVNAFLSECVPEGSEQQQQIAMSMIKNRRPLNIADGYVASVKITIGVVDKKHADADNIFKGILDAMFVNDKKVIHGEFILVPAAEGMVEVEINIIKNEK